MIRPRKAVAVFAVLTMSNVAVGAEFKPGEVIVKYKEGYLRARAEMNSIYNSVGVVGVRRYSGLMKGYEQLTLESTADVESTVSALQKEPAVEYAQPNYILKTLPVFDSSGEVVQNDVKPMGPCWIPGIPFPPGCESDGDGENPFPIPGEPGSSARPALIAAPAEITPAVADKNLSKSYGISKISAEEVWKTFRGDKAFIVADIDTGIDYNHEDLAFNVWRNANPDAKAQDIVGYDFIHNDGLPYDDNQHGTHTGGTIAAVGGNGIGTSGVVQKVSLMSIKFLSGKGEGTTSDAIRSIDYAVKNGARVLSNSWGGPKDAENAALKEAVERAKDKGVLFIAAAGNETNDNDSSPTYPASFDNDNMITVAATDRNDRMAYFSNWGKKSVHLAAPGVDVYSTVPGNKYASLSGTSMACPHVAGAAALIWSRHPDWTYKQVKEALLKSVDPVAGLKNKTITGGRLNVAKAFAAAE